MIPQATILHTNNLTVGYRKGANQLPVLTDINVGLEAGRLVCFMGPNGIGKSTLIRTLCGAQPALKGSVAINGTDLTTYSPGELATIIGVVYTDRIAAGNMGVKELIGYGRYPYTGWRVSMDSEDEKLIDQAIELTHVSHLLHKRIYELSDGQLQKVMIARAVCQDTPIMILDEPTAHLDLNNRVEVINLLHNLSRQTNKAIMMATHELDLALQVADRIWLAGADQPLLDGFPEDLVLNGSFDEVFGLKGYDLKTGTLRKKKGDKMVALVGEGYHYLWSKNALERHGFMIDESASTIIRIEPGAPISWHLNDKGTYSTLEALVSQLTNLR